MEQFWIWLWYVVRDLFAFFAWFCWVALIIGLWLIELRRRRRRAERPPETIEPECANCGYLVVGITSTRCPECGSDLRGRGTILDRYLYTSPMAKAVVCLLLLSVPAYFGWRRVERELPIWRQSSMTYVLNGPMSGAYRSVVIKMSVERWEWPRKRYEGPPYEIAEIRLTHLSGAERSMRAPLFGKPWTRTDFMLPATRPADASENAGHVTAADVLGWMRSQGIDTSDGVVEREAHEVSELIESNVFRGPLTLNSTFATRTPVGTYYFGRPWWMLGGWVALCVAAWVMTMRFIARKRGVMQDAVIPAAPVSDSRPTSPGAANEPSTFASR